MSKVVELKVGSQAIPFEFSMEQFIQHYMYANQKQFEPNSFVEDVISPKQGSNWAEVKHPFANQSAYLDGAPVMKVQKGIFSKKSVPDPSRCFLLFKDETWKEIPAPNNALTQQTGGLWTFNYDPHMDNIYAAGKLYSTGKRIILDAYYMSMSTTSTFPTNQFFGNIDFKSFAGKFNLPHVTLKKFIKGAAKGMPQYEPFPVTGLEHEVEYHVWKDSMSFLGGAVKVNIPGSEKAEHVQINVMQKGLDGSKVRQGVHFIYGVSEELNKEISNLKPVNLEDVVAMWQYAATHGFYQTTLMGLSTAVKKPVSLTV